MTNIRKDLAGAKVLGASKVTLATSTTTSFDFGTPDDINLATNANYRPGDRVMVVLTGTTAGTTNTLTWVVQDADDSAGSIGTPATAVTDVVYGGLAGGTGDDYTVLAVEVQNGRPWLRVRATGNGATDTFALACVVLAIPVDL
jgi:hypothetical protein